MSYNETPKSGSEPLLTDLSKFQVEFWLKTADQLSSELPVVAGRPMRNRNIGLLLFVVCTSLMMTLTQNCAPAMTPGTGIAPGASSVPGPSPEVVKPAELVFSDDPQTEVHLHKRIPPVSVSILDPNGQVVVDAADFIEISILNNANAATLKGTTTVAAVNGVAKFEDLSIDRSGTGYTLIAKLGDLSVTSRSFSVVPPRVSCTATSTDCTPIDLSADPYAPGYFSGYADASVRQDPQTGILWMSYTWPRTMPGNTKVADVHLSYSTDNGSTWNYKGAIHTSKAVTNVSSGSPMVNYTSAEVQNLYPHVINNVTWWFGVHQTYWVELGSADSLNSPKTVRWEIRAAPDTSGDGPMVLASATNSQLIANPLTDKAYWPVDVDLKTLAPTDSWLQACSLFWEPSLTMIGEYLYLFLNCTGPAENVSKYFYPVFKTQPIGDPKTWSWSYVPPTLGRLGHVNDAKNAAGWLGGGPGLPGNNNYYVTQMDIVPSRNHPSSLLAVMSTAYNDPIEGKVGMGCVVAKMASIDPPAFEYDSRGNIQIEAYANSPDSLPDGSGSCTYSPYSNAGLILAHRQSSNAPQNAGFFTYFMKTGLFP